MPTISIFIRNEDLPKWKALGNKSEWLHDKLGGINTYATLNNAQKAAPGTSNTYHQEQAPRPYTPPAEELPCCKNRQPCKHWTWDGIKGTYTNSISGRVVEVTQ